MGFAGESRRRFCTPYPPLDQCVARGLFPETQTPVPAFADAITIYLYYGVQDWLETAGNS